jgi:cyclic beta-1,2-glucan synthetase
VRENVGQYTHAAIWFAMALVRRGDVACAAKMLRLLNPIEHARDSEAVWCYGVEPYVISADVYRLTGRIGQGSWSWYTGSAAWMYRAWIEDVLGMRVRGDHMQIDPISLNLIGNSLIVATINFPLFFVGSGGAYQG